MINELVCPTFICISVIGEAVQKKNHRIVLLEIPKIHLFPWYFLHSPHRGATTVTTQIHPHYCNIPVHVNNVHNAV